MVSCGGSGSGSADDTGGKTINGIWALVTSGGATPAQMVVDALSLHLASPAATIQATWSNTGVTCQYGGISSCTQSTIEITIRYDGLGQYPACGVTMGQGQ